MTIAFDAITTNLQFTASAITIGHTPTGNPAGVFISIVQNAGVANLGAITYGGDALTEIGSSPYISSNGEGGVISLYFKGSGVKTGTQDAVINPTAGAGRYITVMTVTAAADLEINLASIILDVASQANPSGTLALGNQESFVYHVHMSGLSGTNSTAPLAGWTDRGEGDLGSLTSGLYTYDTISDVDVTCGYSAAINDNVHIIAIAVNEEAAPAGVSIATVNAGNSVAIGDTGIIFTGLNFEATTGTLTISPTDDSSDVNARVLTTSAWTDTSITADFPSGLNLLYDTIYVFVTTDTVQKNVAGKAFQLVPPAVNTFTLIESINDAGLLVGTTNIQFGSDQLEYQLLSNAGGGVHIDISGTYYIDYGISAAPATDTIYIRLGDFSDQTWSSSSLTAVVLGSAAANIVGNVAQSLNSLTQSLSASVTANSTVNAGDITQTLNSLTQVSIGNVTPNDTAIASDIAQTLNALTQSASGTLSSNIAGDITQTLNSLTQSATGVVTDHIAGDIAQNIGALTQSATATVTANSAVNAGDINQSVNALIQNAVGVLTPNATVNTGDITQTLNSLTQSATATINLFGHIISGPIAQTLNSLTQTVSATVTTNSTVNAGDINQSLSSLTQSATGVVVRLESIGDISQTLNSLTQTVTAVVTANATTTTGNITQTLSSLTQTAVGNAFGGSLIQGNITQSLNALTQVATATITINSTVNTGDISQSLNSLTQTATGNAISSISGNIAQSLNSLTQTLSGNSITDIDGDITQSLSTLTQTATGVVSPNTTLITGNISMALNSLTQIASDAEILIEPRDKMYTNFDNRMYTNKPTNILVTHA